VKMNQREWLGTAVLGLVMAAALPGWTQTQGQNPPKGTAGEGTAAGGSAGYQPKFAGDPAHSESEAQALGYMRVVLRAQREYKKRHNKFAESLPALAGTGSLTKRMARSPERGDYNASFRSQKDGFILTMTPKQVDAEHRSFYAEEDGIIHGDDQKAADKSSPKVK
jgi:type II secretory pathway pseudopilin PulG